MNARFFAVFSFGLSFLLVAHPAWPNQTLSERVFRSLTEIHELREANQNEKALSKTDQLLSRSLSDHERAQTLLMKSDLLLLLERYREAIDPLEAVLSNPEIPKARISYVRYTLGQLYSQIGKYQDSIRHLEAWVQEAEQPTANAFFMLAVAYLELKQLRQARRHADTARRVAETLSEGQYQFLGSIYLQDKDWKALQQLLEEAIFAFPKQTLFWKQLAQVHMQRNREAEALIVLRLAYSKNLLTRGEDLVQLAQLMRLQEVPWLAAQVLEQGLNDKRIKSTSRHWQLLGDAWMAAREYKKAYPALRKTANMTQKSSDWLKLTRLYAQNAEWKGCADSASMGLRTNPKDPGPFHLLNGICTYEQDNHKDALIAFAEARKIKSTAAQAKSWTQFIEDL